MTTKYQNFINGKWQDSKSGKFFENRNPANWDGDLIGTFPLSTKEDVDEAVAAAKEAFKKWRLVPAPKRGDVLKRVGDMMNETKDEIAFEMTREMGKVFAETKGDTQEGIDTAYYAASEGRRLFGYNAPSELPNKMNLSFRMPIGVGGIITPWNFPMAIPTWKIFPALVCGNTVVFKPAQLTPKTATTLIDIIDKAMKEVLGKDYIPGVVNIVHGAGSVVGNALTTHPDVNLISFTGSSAVGKQINEVAGATLKRVSLELGGKNAQIVMDDADQELAIDAVLWGAFGTTGQRCTATSRLILHEKIYDEFIDKLIKRTSKLKLGYGNDKGVDVGPCVSKEQRETVHGYVEIGLKEGAKLLIGGKIPDMKGWFFEPTLFTDCSINMRIAKEEIFGPVVCILEAKDLEDAIRIANSVEYGLSTSIYTNDVRNSFKAIEKLEAGLTYVNSSTIGSEVHLPFGGVKHTGNTREGGILGIDEFSEVKTVYVDYSGKLQRAQIDID